MNTVDQGGDNADRFLAEAVSDEAVRRRRADRWARQLSIEDATVVGCLAAAVGSVVTITVATSGPISGTVTVVGDDVVEIRTTSITRWVALAAIDSVRTDRPAAHAQGGDGPTLSGLLADLAAERDGVALTLAGGTVLRGDVMAVGESLVLRQAGQTGRDVTVVRLAAIEVVTLL